MPSGVYVMYNAVMTTEAPATRKDIDEVLDLLRDFMHQSDERFVSIETEIVNLKESHDSLLNML